MKYHFADMLDREGDYWTIVPNVERYQYDIESVPEGSKDITIVTLDKNQKEWKKALTFPNLEEITLHKPSKDQVSALSEFNEIKRLRITHLRVKDIEFLSKMTDLEELVLEYVSGFSDLSPLKNLKKLKSVHFENLRKVKDFSGLKGICSLRYLNICGTLDWKQPILNLEFLGELKSLEYLSFWQVITKEPYPCFLPARHLKNIKILKIAEDVFDTEEYALLSVIFEGVEGADYSAYKKFVYHSIDLKEDDVRFHLSQELIEKNHPEVKIWFYEGKEYRQVEDPDSAWFLFIGKNAGRVKCTSKLSDEKCQQKAEEFKVMQEKSKKLIQ